MSLTYNPVKVEEDAVLDYDPVQRIIDQYFEEDGKYILTQTQDAEPVVELNKAQYNSIDERARHKDGIGDKYASIPMVVFMELDRVGIARDEKAFRKWLDDPENVHFRTRPGRLSR